MASTRSKNTPGNYKLEQRANILSKKYDLYQHSQHGSPYKTAIPSIGYTPSFISRDLYLQILLILNQLYLVLILLI